MIPATILVVEDNPITRRLVGAALTREGWDVVEASDGMAALAAIRRRTPDLVLQDLGLPDMDGFELVRRIRAMPHMATVPVVACSSLIALDTPEATPLGFDGFLVKPVEPQRLVQVVGRQLAQRSRERTMGGGRRIVLAEADPLQAKLFGILLRQRGFEVVTAVDGRDALAQAEALPPAAIVSETLMPHTDGFQLCLAVRQHPGLSRVPMILYSSLSFEEESEALARKVGATAVVHSTPDFAGVIDAVLASLDAGAMADEPIDPQVAEHIRHAVTQLERQAAANAAVRERVSLQASTMAILSGISEDLGRKHDEEVGLETVLTHCLDAVGISTGALYLADPGGRLALVAQCGYEADLAEELGHAALIRDIVAGETCVAVPSATVPAATAEAFLARTGGTSALIVPLVAGGECNGVILMVSDWEDLRVHHWLEFAQALSVTLGQTLRLMRRWRESQALARSARELTETLSVSMVAERVVKSVRSLFSVAAAAFRLLQPDGSLVCAAADGAGILGWASVIRPGAGLAGRAVSENRAVSSPDILSDPALALDAELRARVESSGLRASLAVPLKVKETILGVLAVIDLAGRVFTEAETALLQTFADQAALALQNARLYEEAERRRHEAEVLADITARTSASFDLETILQRVAEGAQEISGCDQSLIALREPPSGELIARHWSGTPSSDGALWIRPGKAVGDQVLLTARAFRTEDYTNDARICDEHVALAEASGLRALICVAIGSAPGIEGVLCVGNRSTRPLTERDEATLQRLADHAAIAIQQARQRETLHQTEKLSAMGELLAGVAHELNNPLTVLTAHALLLGREVTGTAAGRVAKIQRAGDRCARIVKNFLALARQRPPERTPTDLRRVVSEALELLAYPLRVDDVEVRFEPELPGDLPLLWADPHQLHQVMVNLISNAHQAMRSEATPRRLAITICHDAARARVVLQVSDTGRGIPPAVRSRIFEPFFTTKPLGQGTGLGLPLCKGIVENHGGTIAAASEPGKGAMFTIELPVVSPPAAATGGDLAPAAIAPRTILVVDDEPDVAEVLAAMLEQQGHRVETVIGGAAALERLRGGTYDIVMSDLKMPDVDGPELYRRAQLLESRPRPRFVFVTGDVLGLGTAGFLERTSAPRVSKPFSPEELARAVLEASA